MKKIFFKFFLFFNIVSTSFLFGMPSKAEWTLFSYIQVDNNLASWGDRLIEQMVTGYRFYASSTSLNVNTIVQIDYPQDQKTWRFRITPAGRVEDGSVNQEMGLNPAQEIIDAFTWLVSKYPANKYAFMIWNHGSGVEDFRPSNKYFSEYDVFSYPSTSQKDLNRGVLYDDSQNTCLTNPAMKIAFGAVKTIIGKKLDILIMDACMMAMLEVEYQLRDSVEFCLASQQIKYAGNWSYSDILRQLLATPLNFDGRSLAGLIVELYRASSGYGERTGSSVDLKNISLLKDHVNFVSNKLLECKKYSATAVKSALINARSRCPGFYYADYIDLFNFYAQLKPELVTLLENARQQPVKGCCGLFDYTAKYIGALEATIVSLNEIDAIFRQVVIAYVSGPARPDAHGLSIYFPKPGESDIHASYYSTDFVKETSWVNLLEWVRS